MNEFRNIPEPDFESPEEVDAYLVAHGYNLDTLQRNMNRFMTLLKRAIASRKQYHVRECYPGEPTPEDDWRVYAYGDEDEMIADMQDNARRRFLTANLITHRFPVKENDYSQPVMMMCRATNGGVIAPFYVFVTLDGVMQ